MGVSKDVDMEFMRRHGIIQLQVLVMNPNLIPQSVNIVIGESLYELKFRVGLNVEGAPHPMDMNDNHEADGPGQWEMKGANPSDKQANLGLNDGSGGAVSGVNKMSKGGGKPFVKSLLVFFIQVPPGLTLEDKGVGVDSELVGAGREEQPVSVSCMNIKKEQVVGNQEDRVVEDVPVEEDSSQADSLDTTELEMALKEWGDEEENSRLPSAKELAAIPEVSLEQLRLGEASVGQVWLMRRWEFWPNVGKR
jgi:hypothetical protein